MDRRDRRHIGKRPFRRWLRRRAVWIVLTIAALVVGVSAYMVVIVERSTSGATLPVFVLTAHAPIRAAYAYALGHPDVLQYIPCYCGCGNKGHISNQDCFIDHRLPDGGVVYDPMGSA